METQDKPINETLDKPIIHSEYDVLVVSGCAVNGVTALGSIQYFHDNFLLKKLDTYIGTSCGSIICYLLIIGCTPIEILTFLCTNKVLELTPPLNLSNVLNGMGAISFNHFYHYIEQLTLEKIGRLLTLGELEKKFEKKLICVTYNVTQTKTEYLSPDNYPEIPCLIAIKMSCNLPFMFDPFQYMNNYYIDGGVTDNFPLEKAITLGNKVLGIVIDNGTQQDHPGTDPVGYFFGIINTMINSRSNKYADTLITDESVTVVKVGNVDVDVDMGVELKLSNKNTLDLFSSGYQTCKLKFL